MKRTILAGVAGAAIASVICLGAGAFGAGTVAAPTSDGTLAMANGTSLSGSCAQTPTATVSGKTGKLTCPNPAVVTTTTTAPPVTTTTLPPTTTTTVPPTTTTTTTTPPSNGQCTSANSALGPFAVNPNITPSNGYNTYVSNQNVGAATTSTMTSCAYNNVATDFTTTATATTDPNGEVQYYPDLQQLFTNNSANGQAISSLNTLSSTFNSTNPSDSVGSWEQAYDIWFNSADYPADVMIWTNTSNSLVASNYGGATIDNPSVTIAGVNYTLIHFGKIPATCTTTSFTGCPERMLVMNTNESSGTVNVLADIQYLQSIGDLPSSARLMQVNFGWEVRQTVGTQTFALNNYTLSEAIAAS